MVIDGDQGQRLLAKARQLKERALGTADRTRRKQLLLIATEYQKLARVAAPNSAIGLSEFAGSRNVTGGFPRGQIAVLRPDLLPAAPAHTEIQIDKAEQARQPIRFIDLVVLAVVTLVAFALVLIPGDQTLGGLYAIFAELFN